MWYYHRDADGREWGPFTPGQLTHLFNLGVLEPRSLIRADSEDTWHTFYRKPQPKNWFDVPIEEDFEEKMARGDRLCEELQRHVQCGLPQLPWGDVELPWRDVEDARRDHRLQTNHPASEAERRFARAGRCPCCQASPETLSWFYFESPPPAWRLECGCAGWMAVCDRCRIQVYFAPEVTS